MLFFSAVLALGHNLALMYSYDTLRETQNLIFSAVLASGQC
jgi:hypothetical protein